MGRSNGRVCADFSISRASSRFAGTSDRKQLQLLKFGCKHPLRVRPLRTYPVSCHSLLVHGPRGLTESIRSTILGLPMLTLIREISPLLSSGLAYSCPLHPGVQFTDWDSHPPGAQITEAKNATTVREDLGHIPKTSTEYSCLGFV